jgi:hypothetical protein
MGGYIHIEDPNKCVICSGEIADHMHLCPSCGFPQNGTDDEQRDFVVNHRRNKLELKAASHRIGYAFHLLLFIPVAMFVIAIIIWQETQWLLGTEVMAIAGAAFLSIYIFGRKDPARAFGLSLLLYSLLAIPLMIFMPKVIWITHFWIVAPFIFLPIGMRSFKDWKLHADHLDGKNS